MKGMDSKRRSKLALAIAMVGEDICDRIRELETAGFAIPAIRLRTLAEFSEKAEIGELEFYLQEQAKETVGSVGQPGTYLVAGDGFVSPYIEGLRQDRNSNFGGMERYRLGNDSPWLFELAGGMRRMREAQSIGDPRIKALQESTAHQISAESRRYSARMRGAAFTDPAARFQCCKEAIQEALEGDGVEVFGLAYNKQQSLFSLALHEGWSVALYLPSAPSFWDSYTPTYLFSEWYLYEGSPSEAEKAKLQGHAKTFRLRLDEILPGLSEYSAASSFAELALAAHAKAAVIKLFRPTLCDCLSKLT